MVTTKKKMVVARGQSAVATTTHSVAQGAKKSAGACMITSNKALGDRLAMHLGDIPRWERLANVHDEPDCSVYLVDTKVSDIGTWPALLSIDPNAQSKLWLFLVSTFQDTHKLGSLPRNCRFFSRELSQVSHIASFVERYLDPEMGKRIAKVQYAEEDRSFVIYMQNGKVYVLKLDDLPEADSSQVIHSKESRDGSYFRVRQESGNSFEVPWDYVLYHCEPAYEYHKDRRSPQADRELATRIGERIRQLRTSKGLTIEGLAREAGMKRPNLSRLEHGKHSPSLDTVERLAEALAVPVADLVAKAS